MPKTATDTVLSGPTMGTSWQVRLDEAPANRDALHAALQAAVAEVDDQMSTWKHDSALMRFNAAPCDVWHPLPDPLLELLETGLAISKITGDAFEMNLGDAVRAWGFGSTRIDLPAIRAASAASPVSAATALQIDRSAGRALKSSPLSLDLSGIAKGYGVDCLAETLYAHGVTRALCSIDGEVRALGARQDGTPWSIGIDEPDSQLRGGHSVIMLEGRSIATSGDYRHFVEIRGRRLSHTMDPTTRAPLVDAPASVTVMAQSCMHADAMATALMVLGLEQGTRLARELGISVLCISRNGKTRQTGVFAI